MVELVIFRVNDFYCGYVREKMHICAWGESVEEVTDELIHNIEVYEFVQMELALIDLLNELNITRPNEPD